MSNLINAIPEEKMETRGWKPQEAAGTLRVNENGEIVLDLQLLRFLNPAFGQLSVGMTPGGYDGWAFHENGGGGSVIVPYVIVNGHLFVGMVQQGRFLQGGQVWNVPRGFLEPKETHFETAVRELKEETGFKPAKDRLQQLGSSLNPNSAFFDTSLEGEGVRFYGLQVLPGELSCEPAEEGKLPTFVFNRDMIKSADVPEKTKKVSELILGCRFFHVSELMFGGFVTDMFSVVGAGMVTALMCCCQDRTKAYA